MTYTPHPYQRETICSLKADQKAGYLRTVVLLPTGTGKTVIMAFLVRETKGKIVIVVHRDELADQTVKTIKEVAPKRTVGIVGFESNDLDADVVVASVAALARSPLRIAALGKVALLIIDECHHASAPIYQTVIVGLGGYVSTPVVGFTATLVRADDLKPGDTWQKISYTRSIEWAEENGFLVRHTTETVQVPALNLTDVKVDKTGDYATADLSRALVHANAGAALASAYRRLAGDRQGIVFTPTVAAAEHVASAFEAEGLRCAIVTGATPKEDRKLIFKRIEAHDLQVIVNVMVLTEGFDLPQLEVAVIARPTRSKSLKVQMVGRVKRLSAATGKTSALVLIAADGAGEIPVKTYSDMRRSNRPPVRTPPALPTTARPQRTDGRAGSGRGRPDSPEPATARRPAAAYKITISGLLVTVTRTVEGEKPTRIDVKKAKPGADPIELGRLIVKLDQTRRR